MTNKYVTVLLSVLIGLSVYTGMSAQEKQLTLYDLIPGGKTYSHFVPRNLRQLQWLGDRYIYVRGDSVRISSGEKEEVALTLERLNAVLAANGKDTLSGMPVLTVPSKNGTEISFTHKQNRYHYDLEKNQLTAAYSLQSGWSNYEYSSANRLIAFTEGNNVKILTPGNEVITVTNETAPHIVCGQAVHQREFGIMKGLFWSPAGNALAFYRMDESMVTDYPLVDISARCAVAEPFKYPMAGMKSHEVIVGVYHPERKETVWLKTGPVAKEEYLTNIGWSPDGQTIYIAELNRDQNEMKLVSYDASTGVRKRELFTETAETYVEPQNPVLFVPGNSKQFIWQSERDGYNHLYLYDTDGKLLKQLTSGNWVVKEVLGFDRKGEHVLILSTAPSPAAPSGNHTAMDTYAWKVNLKNGKSTCITPARGVHQVTASADGESLLDTYSAPDVPRTIEMRSLRNGKSRTLLTANDPFRNYAMPGIECGVLKAADGVTDLNYRIVKPRELDENKKYPAIIYVYGGPHAQLINGGWQYGTRGWDIYMAQKGYIVFTVDGRGSANRGHAFESAIFRNLGENEMADQMKGVDYLLSLPYVDAGRIGVHGWSYGGFMTTNLMLTYPDVFKVGVAGGPVIDWKMYEIMYGERYMDHPKDNPEGYKRNDLKQRAGDLKGRLMLIHGDMDPVVVWQHSLGFLKACVDAGTYPDYFVYPGHGHNVTGKDRPHLYEKITRYFEDFL